MKQLETMRAVCRLGWTTAAFTLVRLSTLIVLEVKLRHRDPDVVLWDISHQADTVALHALFAALVVVALARIGKGSRTLACLAVLVSTCACVSAFSGWPVGQVHQVPGFDSLRNRLGWTLFLGGGALVSLFHRRIVEREWPSKNVKRHAAAALAAALLLPAGFYWSLGTASSHRTVVGIHREFAFENDLWDVARVNPHEKPTLSNLTPSSDYRVDGGDRPAILMPPPCELTIVIKEEDAGCHFQTAVGIGRDTLATPATDHPPWPNGLKSIQIRFEVELDGQGIYDQTVAYTRKVEDQSDRIWHYVGFDEEIPVKPGQELTLRTSWVTPVFHTDIKTPVAICGFGSPQLVQRTDLPRTKSSPDTPNIVLIVMDTLRADRLSCYEYPKETTPNLDALAARGLLYEEARATSSWTWPSTASILTGLHPQTHGVVSDGKCYLDAQLQSLPEALERRGYTTVAFTCNPLIVPNKNFHQGFENFDSYPAFRKSDVVLDTIKNFMQRYAGTRFFLYLHLVDPHDKYQLTATARARVGLPDQPPEGMQPRAFKDVRMALLRSQEHRKGEPLVNQLLLPEYQEWILNSYDAAVATADDYVGDIMAELSDLGLTEETIIVFTSDHGEELFEHGHLAHGQSLHEELVRVPIIMAGPGIPAGVRTDKLVSNRHIAPTLAKFGGVELPGIPDPMDLSRPDALEPGAVITSTHQGWWNGQHRLPIYGITTEEWALHWAPKGAPWAETPDPDGMWRLYRRESDPHEHIDVAADHPEVATELLNQLKEALAEASKRSSRVSLGVGAATAQMLIEIGYTGTDDSDENNGADNAPEPQETNSADDDTVPQGTTDDGETEDE